MILSKLSNEMSLSNFRMFSSNMLIFFIQMKVNIFLDLMGGKSLKLRWKQYLMDSGLAVRYVLR